MLVQCQMAVTIPKPQETGAGAAPGAQKERALWGGPPRQKLQPSVEVCSLLGQAEGKNTLSLFSSPPRSSSRAPCWLSSPEAGGQGVCGSVAPPGREQAAPTLSTQGQNERAAKQASSSGTVVCPEPLLPLPPQSCSGFRPGVMTCLSVLSMRCRRLSDLYVTDLQPPD